MNDVRSRFTFFPSMDIQLTESHLLNSPWLLHSITFFTFELNQATINIWICFYIIYFVTLVCLFIPVQDQTVFIAVALQQVLRSGKLMFNVYDILILEWVAWAMWKLSLYIQWNLGERGTRMCTFNFRYFFPKEEYLCKWLSVFLKLSDSLQACFLQGKDIWKNTAMI